MAVINGSYGEREKWVGEFSLQHSTTTFCAKGGGGGSYKKRKRKKEEVQHAMKNMIPESNGKDRTLKEEEEGS